MSKKHFIALANMIIAHNDKGRNMIDPFTEGQIAVLATVCEEQNPLFKRDRWIDYINGKVGPNGGELKKAA